MTDLTGCYAVIFTNELRPELGDDGHEGYDAMAARMVELSADQPGFLGIKSVRDGLAGITVSYWESEAAIAAWKANAEHTLAREKGRAEWYADYQIQVCKVERAYGFG